MCYDSALAAVFNMLLAAEIANTGLSPLLVSAMIGILIKKEGNEEAILGG